MGYDDNINAAHGYVKVSNYTWAADEFKRAASNAPDPDRKAQAYLNAGRCYLAVLDYGKARNQFNEALDTKSAAVIGEANYYLGLSYIGRREYDDAQTALLAAAQGGHQQANIKLNELYCERGVAALFGRNPDASTAIDYFNKAMSMRLVGSQERINYYLGLAHKALTSPDLKAAYKYFLQAKDEVLQLRDRRQPFDAQVAHQVSLEIALLNPQIDQP